MTEIWNALLKAVELIVSRDAKLIEIAWLSLRISGTATLLAALICIPLGSLIHFRQFHGKRLLINVVQTLFSVPTVIVGLFVFVLFSRAGPLGWTNILFTPGIMIIGQTILITPILLGLTISALSGVERQVADTAISLGASGFQTTLAVLREARYAVLAAVIMGFGRAISELGLALMVGGNIRGFTRTITTAISLETAKGELELAIALGIILLCLALIVNITMNRIQQR
ncbi:ABC transporter permease [Chloroflexota bacterium]